MALDPILTNLLKTYGLTGLIPWAEEMILTGASPEQIELELYDQPLFKIVFPEIEARRLKAEQKGQLHFAPISADDIMTYRTEARAMMRSMGLPPGMYAQDADFFDLIVNDVSIDELGSRLDLASARVAQAPPEVRQVFSELTGSSADDALFALFVNPTKALPVLENMVQKAEAGGAARRFGFNIGEAAMDRLEAANLDYESALRGFGELDVARSLFDESLYEDVDFTVESEGIEAAFGLAGGAARKLEQRAETRTAQTQGHRGGLVEERGATGLGGAGRR